MRVLIAGAHGGIGLRLGRLLAARGDTVLGVIRNPAHAADLEAAGVQPVLLDLETAEAEAVAGPLRGVDAAVLSDGATPAGVDEVFVAYLRAKLAAEDDLRGRDLDWTILRPGGLTDDPGTGRVRLEPSVPRGAVPRDDVAEVLVHLLDDPRPREVLELVGT